MARPSTKLREKTGTRLCMQRKRGHSKDHFTSTFTRIQGWMQH